MSTVNASSPHSAVAVGAHDPNRRVRLASERPSDARTQPTWRGSATRVSEDAAARRAGRREACAEARGGGARGKLDEFEPALKAQCGKKSKQKKNGNGAKSKGGKTK
jgi:hypothetical protein